MAQLSFNIQKTKAILIGVSEYKNLKAVKPVANNISDLAAVLMDKNIIGLPAENILQIVNEKNDEILDRVFSFLQDPSNIDVEMLIFYYAGHGIRELTNGELFLTGTNSAAPIISASGIRYSELKKAIEHSHIRKRLILIDSCHSGLAAQDGEVKAYTNVELDVKGSYVITSSSDEEKSFFDSAGRNTFFTSYLLEVMKSGVPDSGEFVSLDDVYLQLQLRSGLSEPQRKNGLNVNTFKFFRNPKYDPGAALEQQANQLFTDNDFKHARSKYLEVNLHKPSEQLWQKIKECDRFIEIENNIEHKWKTFYETEAKEAERKIELKWKGVYDTKLSDIEKERASHVTVSSPTFDAEEKERQRDLEFWKYANGMWTVGAFKDYLAAFPKSERKNQALEYIAKIEKGQDSEILSRASDWLSDNVVVILSVFVACLAISVIVFLIYHQSGKTNTTSDDHYPVPDSTIAIRAAELTAPAVVAVDTLAKLRYAGNLYNAVKYDSAFFIYSQYSNSKLFSDTDQYRLAKIYVYGKIPGAAPDYRKAVECFAAAGEKGMATAQYSLGVMYENGYGVVADMKMARDLFAKAARQNDKNAINACKGLGINFNPTAIALKPVEATLQGNAGTTLQSKPSKIALNPSMTVPGNNLEAALSINIGSLSLDKKERKLFFLVTNNSAKDLTGITVTVRFCDKSQKTILGSDFTHILKIGPGQAAGAYVRWPESANGFVCLEYDTDNNYPIDGFRAKITGTHCFN